MNGTRGSGESVRKLESCLEFRDADFKAFVRHLHERRCEKCWKLFAAAEQSAPNHEVSGRVQNVNRASASEGRQVPATAKDISLDRWLIKEYSLIPPTHRPIVGSNDWFRWLDEFQERHPADVARLDQPLAMRAQKVLWDST